LYFVPQATLRQVALIVLAWSVPSGRLSARMSTESVEAERLCSGPGYVGREEELRVLRFQQRGLVRVLAACTALSSIACLVLWSASPSSGVGPVGDRGMAWNPSRATGFSRLASGSFFRHVGRLDIAGNLLITTMTIRAAKEKCLSLPHCAGFGFAGEEPSSDDEVVEIAFNAHRDVRRQDRKWTSYTLEAAANSESSISEETISPYTVEACSAIRGPRGELIHPAKLAALATAGFSWCAVALGAMVVATETVNPNLILFAANVLGELLDKNCDGHPDDQSVVEPFSAYNHMGYSAVLTMGDSFAQEQPAFNTWSLVAVPSGAYRLQGDLDWEGTKAVVAEQAFHLLHRHGWAIAYPLQFGFPSTWTTQAENSHACDCMKEAQCTWYQHSSNRGCKNIRGEFCMNPTAPDDHTDATVLPGTCRAVEGTCAGPECDCLEFVHKVFVAYTGDIPAQGDLYAHQLEQRIASSGQADTSVPGGPVRAELALEANVFNAEPTLPLHSGVPLGLGRLRRLSIADETSSMKDNLMRSPACTLLLRDIENVSLPFPRHALTERARKRQCA